MDYMARLGYKDGLYSETRLHRWIIWQDKDRKVDNMARLGNKDG